MHRFFSSFSQQRIFGGAVVLAATQFGASLMGLLRDRALTVTFPDLDTVDVYIAAFRPSDLLFQITIMAGLSTVLVPLLARYRAHEKQKDMSELLSSVMGIGSLTFGAVALILALLLPYIATSIVGFEGESLRLYIRYAQLALFTNFLFVIGNAIGQYLITIQRYWMYGLTPILYTLGTIVGTLYLTPLYGPMGPMIGTLLGAFAYVIMRLTGAMYSGFTFSLRVWHPDLLRMGWLMLPRMVALGALQGELLLFDTIASHLPNGSVTINAYARNFQSVVVGIVGIALAQSVFSLLSQSAAKNDMHRFWIYLRKSLVLILLLTIPGAIALYLMAPVAAYLVHLTDVLPLFALCLGVYAISIPFESINHVLLRSFYALHKTTIPAFFNVLNGVAAVVTAWFLYPIVGVLSLAVGFTVGQVIQMIGLAFLIPFRAQSTSTG